MRAGILSLSRAARAPQASYFRCARRRRGAVAIATTVATKKSGGEAAGPLRVPLRGHGGRPRRRPQTLPFHDHPELLRAEAGDLGPAPAEQLPGGEQLFGRRQPDAAPRAALRSWVGLFQHGRAAARVPRPGLPSLRSQVLTPGLKTASVLPRSPDFQAASALAVECPQDNRSFPVHTSEKEG